MAVVAPRPRSEPMPRMKTTWLDWFPDEPEPTELYTRDQIAEMASGIDPVTGDDIRYWEYQGVLPRSVRRRHEGATRAVYPAWYADLAKQVRQLQRQGMNLDEIRSRLRTRVVSVTPAITPPVPSELVAALGAFARDYAEASGAHVTHIQLEIAMDDGSGSIFGIPIGPNGEDNLQ